MAVITASIEIDGQPLRRAYVEHTGPLGIGSLGFYLTDNNGRFTFDAGLLANQADIKIHCQNSVIRVVNGRLSNSGISFQATVTNGITINITTNRDHFRILNTCLDVYDIVWRQFRPYNRENRRDFPIGRPQRSSIRDIFSNSRRIELSYPDNFPVPLAFVEPSGLTNSGFPLVHIKDRAADGRLFGVRDAFDPSLLPHELGHAFHFSALTGNTRIQLETEYLSYLVQQIPSGNFFHSINQVTSPVVAFVEAAGIFSERFFFFRRRIRPNLTGENLRRAFFQSELSQEPDLSEVLIEPYTQVARRNTNGIIEPMVQTGNNVEGAIYGAIYLDFASRVGLREAVGLVLDSNATDFNSFRNFVRGRNNAQFTAAINAVRNTWNL